jgi:thiazole/oxazole-forming peptide maturase SagD family component
LHKTGQIFATAGRGQKCELHLTNRPICHHENGLRSVPIKSTVRNIEHFFLNSPIEIQFAYSNIIAGNINRAILKYHSPVDKLNDQYYYGKGITTSQHIASACFEFFERYSASMRSDDLLLAASFNEVANKAIDPCLFNLSADTTFHPAKEIDWIWGYSLSGKKSVLVPANLVFFPYEAEPEEKHIVRSDTNGLASGNNLEEAILHGLLEVIERDQVMISEYNRLPVKRIIPESLPAACTPMLDQLKKKGFQVFVFASASDLPISYLTVFLGHKKNILNCTVASGCHLDPVIALERAITEAVQMLPPVANFEGWFNSGAPQFYLSSLSDAIHFDTLKNQATADIKKNIEICLSFLKEIKSEVIAVDLSQPDIPFPVVRMLATQLQPILHRDYSRRFSPRFFEVPVKLGFRSEPLPVSAINIWPICGYR